MSDNKIPSMGSKPITDLTGKRFGRLKVREMASYRKGRRVVWTCECECGNVIDIPGIYLTKKNGTKSCGCIVKKHGMFGTRIYNVWHTMKERCYVETQTSFPNYGGRGIKVCPEWQEFIPFMEWSYENGYDENAERGECTLDRIDPNGDYCPENCRWVSMSVQANNKTDNVYIEYNGVVDTLSNHARKVGINPVLAEGRKIKGKSPDEIFAKKKEPKTLYYKGKNRKINDICKMAGVSRSVIERRVLKNGENLETAIEKAKSVKRKPFVRNRKVFQYDLDMNFIKEWENISTICKTLGYKKSAIGNCCLGYLKTSYGYIWRYDEEG